MIKQLIKVRDSLKFQIEASYDEVRSDKLSKHHDNILSLIKDIIHSDILRKVNIEKDL